MSDVFEKKYQGEPSVFGRTAVLLGGLSAEREVSLKSGAAILASLEARGVDAFGIDIQKNVVEQITAEKFDRAFIALHGPGGEDGKVQALLSLLEIPYTGSDHASSAIAMDKWQTKRIWNAQSIPTPKAALLTEGTEWGECLDYLGGEVFVKPVHEGSSIGMSVATSASELKTAFIEANKFDSYVFAETRIVGGEFTVPILGGKALPPIGLKPKSSFYDYDAKYISNETGYLCPCGLSEEKIEELKSLALESFALLGCSGWGRVDAMMTASGEFQLLEANTVPGMTDHSLVPMGAKAAGLTFDDLVLEILFQTVVND